MQFSNAFCLLLLSLLSFQCALPTQCPIGHLVLITNHILCSHKYSSSNNSESKVTPDAGNLLLNIYLLGGGRGEGVRYLNRQSVNIWK